jgi:hypothetical protein
MHRLHLPIANPCHADWSAMDRAEGERRFCSQCDKHVHDLSAMTEPQARVLLSAPRTERLCVRYRTGSEGDIRFRVRSAPAPLPRRVMATVRTAMAAGLLATLAGSSGCTDPERAPISVEHDRCTYEVGPFGYTLERGEGSCPPAVVDVVMGSVALNPEPPPVKGELVAVEPEPEMGEEEAVPMGKVAPALPPEPTEVPCMGQAPAPTPEIEVMGDVAAPLPSPSPTAVIPTEPPPILD